MRVEKCVPWAPFMMPRKTGGACESRGWWNSDIGSDDTLATTTHRPPPGFSSYHPLRSKVAELKVFIFAIDIGIDLYLAIGHV